MKKTLALTLCLFAAAMLFAQPNNPKDDAQRKKDFERLQSEKIAFITSELDLTPAEAQVFWPVYNQCWKEARESHKAMMDAFGEFRGDKADKLSDAELEKLVDAYVKANKASNQVLSDWYPKFREVLPIRKVAKLYQAEDAFQMKMIDKLRHHPQKPQKPQK